MVYIFENLACCDEAWLTDREKRLPAWRLEKVNSLKKNGG